MHKIRELFNVSSSKNLINVSITALALKLFQLTLKVTDITSISDLFRILSCRKCYLHKSLSAKKFC